MKEYQRAVTEYASSTNTELQTLIAHYTHTFKSLYGEAPPDPEYDDLAALRELLAAYKLDRGKHYVAEYVQLDNEWIREQGYPLKFIKKHIAAIIVRKGKELAALRRQIFVIGISEHGSPVCSYHQNESDWYPAMLLEEWIRAPFDKKLQLSSVSESRWKASGNDIESWIRNWNEWGMMGEASSG